MRERRTRRWESCQLRQRNDKWSTRKSKERDAVERGKAKEEEREEERDRGLGGKRRKEEKEEEGGGGGRHTSSSDELNPEGFTVSLEIEGHLLLSSFAVDEHEGDDLRPWIPDDLIGDAVTR